MKCFFFDESGFTTVSPVPYAWQMRGQTLGLPTTRSRRVSVLGCINHALKGQFEVVEGSVDRHQVIDFIDRFAQKRPQQDPPCLLVMDNAPIHRSRDFKAKWLEWAANRVIVAYLPPYSPELNHIEILWRKMKYEWLPLDACNSFASLKQALQEILNNIGSKYQVNFV